MRKMYGVGKPRALQGLRAALFSFVVAALTLMWWLLDALTADGSLDEAIVVLVGVRRGVLRARRRRPLR